MSTDTTTSTEVERRVEYIAGLRLLATILEDHPDLPLPYHGRGTELLWIANFWEDHKAIAREFARAIPGEVTKNVRDDAFDLIGNVRGLRVQLIVDRDQVCERVVVGTETVTVPARPAIEAEPEHTEEREVVEWRCAPLLDDASAQAERHHDTQIGEPA